MSFIPYLQRPPTHTQTGADVPSDDAPTMTVDEDTTHKAAPITTASNTDPHGPRRWYSTMVRLSGKNRAVNELSVERVGEPVEDNLVMLHGYGAGLGFFYKNFEGLSRTPGWKLWALDMLGMGRSTRPPFVIRAKDRQEKIAEAESWFIDALEEWRKQRKVERFTLLGHSLGGYLAVAYALKYPGHLNKLILASPVGVPEDPYAVEADMPDPATSNTANEFLRDQSETVNETSRNNANGAKTAGDNNNFLNARSKAEKQHQQQCGDGTQAPPTAPRRPIPKWLNYLWEANVSPFSIVRWTGPLGPRFVSGWTSRRFSHLPSEEAKALHNYSYSLFRLRGSGEYALTYILAPGAFARNPLIRRIHGVGRQYIHPTHSSPPSSSAPSLPIDSTLPSNADPSPQQPSSSSATSASSSSSSSPQPVRETGIPIVMLYGENDWMDVAGGFAAEHRINEEKERILRNASDDERRADRGSAKVLIVKKAGHHVYLDGAEEFNELIRKEMEDVTRGRKEAKSTAAGIGVTGIRTGTGARDPSPSS